MKKITLISSILFFSVYVFAQNCSAPSTGFIPINDLGTGTFNGWTGGLYSGGSNAMPPAHLQAGLAMAQQVQCLDTSGNADANGKIVWLSIGMSNTTQETQQFIPMANSYPSKNPKVILVDGAQGGQTASIISTSSNSGYANFWNTVTTRLTNAGVTANQVQVIWLKEANIAGAGPVQAYYDSIVVQFKRIANELKTRFPNVKLCYMASRISARYATTTLNPEPYSYWTGWAVKKVIEDQINGDPQLQHSGINANAPWLSWGIYMWSDGSTPQTTNPNILWNCPADFNADGTHPSTAGAQKVGALLLNFFTTDSTATPWFLGTGCPSITGINNPHSEEKNIFLFPNPAINQLTIGNMQSAITSVEIYDVMGEKAVSCRLIADSQKQITVDVSSLGSGIYFVKVKGEKEERVAKFVKQ
ncbi:MAG: T9SS type A sorting domain-containing protein [Bacteroidia bacterium]|nr:T9SS type A sorting domain-containing protein [Bacteroidia bacterium]